MIEVQQIPWTAAHEKLLTAFVGKSTPDLAQLGNTWVSEFVQLNALEPLGPRVAASRRSEAGFVLPRRVGHERHRRRALRASLVRGHARSVLSARRVAARRIRFRSENVGGMEARDGKR
jgi:hypothetical protein